MRRNNFKGKKILFFAPSFFGYEYEIKNKLEEFGASVDIYDDRPTNSSIGKILIRLNPYFLKLKTNRYFKKIIKDNYKKKYDYVFFIKAEAILKNDLIEMKKIFKSAQFILYLYDSVKNIKYYSQKKEFFDRILSFDMNDCFENNEMIFRPLFYLDIFADINEINEVYDMCFIGSYHSDRLKIIYNIYNQYVNKDSLYLRIFVPSKLIYLWKYISSNCFRKLVELNIITLDKMTSREVSQIERLSNAIIDIQHPKQTGLTMRTIEILGLKKKLITTNTNIVHYDFFNDTNVKIIDRDFVKLNNSVIENKYQELSSKIYTEYSLDFWLEDVFDLK